LAASPLDAATAYVAADLHVQADYKPYFLRTHDYGKTWTAIVTSAHGPASGSFARMIRADTKKGGAAVPGDEERMYVSFDDATIGIAATESPEHVLSRHRHSRQMTWWWGRTAAASGCSTTFRRLRQIAPASG